MCASGEPLRPPKPFWNPNLLVDLRQVEVQVETPMTPFWPGPTCAVTWRLYPTPGLDAQKQVHGRLEVQGTETTLRVDFRVNAGQGRYRVSLQNATGASRRLLDADYPVLQVDEEKGAVVLQVPCLWLPPAGQQPLTWQVTLYVPDSQGKPLVCDMRQGTQPLEGIRFWRGTDPLVLPDQADDVLDVRTGEPVSPLPTWADVRGLQVQVREQALDLVLLPERYPPPEARTRWSVIFRLVTGFLRPEEPIRTWLCGRTLSGSAGYLNPKTLQVQPQSWVQFLKDDRGPGCRFSLDLPAQGCFAVSAVYLVQDLEQGARHQDTLPMQPVCFAR